MCDLLKSLILGALIVWCPNLQAGDVSPDSKKTPWRIPANPAVSSDIDWLLVRHRADQYRPGHINLEAPIGDHCTYETAWAYYTQLLEFDPKYPPATNRQEKQSKAGNRHIVKEAFNDKGRFTHMVGVVGNYRLHLYLWTDGKNTSTGDRVYVKMSFTPE